MTDAEIVLRKLLDKITEEPYKDGTRILKKIIVGGANYTSALYSVTITARNEEDLNLFAKVANVSGKLRETMNLKSMFETEQYIYKELARTYEKIQEKHNVERELRFKFPKFYGGENIEGEETIVLEDLVSKGYSSYDRFKSIDWDHAKTAVEALARFHALSFAFEKEDPVNFEKACETLTYFPPENRDNNMTETFLKILSGSVEVAREEHKEAVTKFLYADPEKIFKFKFPLNRPVLCHGDYRISNNLLQRQVS